MTSTELKNHLEKMQEVEILDFYNTMACCFGSSDDMIYYNDDEFYKTQFLNSWDSQVSKINPESKFNEFDKFVKMLEYKKLETANSIFDLMNLDVLIELIAENLEEVKDMNVLNLL
ncbi:MULTISPECIES: hypothetical protein [unclassified Empedobacter]|uniref:hypothetical protein n=1 Tax=unclassified Empedobacter TaxID=2643773 RepID=UPI0025BF0756|nr:MULTISPECIES: hypothetical protein [unclassified Empedobacter]